MTRRDYETYDYLIAMDRNNLRNMVRFVGSDPEHKVSLLMDHTSRPGVVADPWYTGEFEATWQEVLEGGTALLAKLGAWQVARPCRAASLRLWLVLFVLARKGIAAQAPLYLPGRGITIAVLAVGALAFVLANAMPNLPLPESLHNLLVCNDDWGT